jgi:fructosamine-3-kinase
MRPGDVVEPCRPAESDAVPTVLASDAALGVFAMEYLNPSEYEPWKARLARGVVNAETATQVGRQLASIHSSFARSATSAIDFDTGPAFHSLRLEPYLLATARVHRDLAPILESLAERTASTKLTVAHGDVSPKNILLGPRGPVFLDAECAWFGDPAFDLAFCLNHLLKSWLRRSRTYLGVSTRFHSICVAWTGSLPAR